MPRARFSVDSVRRIDKVTALTALNGCVQSLTCSKSRGPLVADNTSYQGTFLTRVSSYSRVGATWELKRVVFSTLARLRTTRELILGRRVTVG
jgi:hypothetical protein